MKTNIQFKNTVGKGIKELLQENEYALENEVIVELNLDDIRPNPYQPRYIFNDEKITELAASISKHGVFQPIIVKKMTDHYSIVAGERRFRACKLLDLKTVPAIVRMYEKDKMIQIALIENLQRENLGPIEEAKGYLQMIRQLGITQKEVANKVGKSRSHVTNMLGLLNLSDNVIELVDKGIISMGHARVLSKINDQKKVDKLANMIVAENLSVRDIEKLSKESLADSFQEDKKILAYQNKLDSKYNIKTTINNNKLTITAPDKIKVIEILEKLLGKR